MSVSSSSNYHPRNLIKTFLVALICIAIIGGLQIPRLNQIKDDSQTQTTEELQRQVQAEKVQLNLLKQIPSFGFDNIIADWAFLKYLQYFGNEEARDRTGYDLNPDYFEIIVNRDPLFLDAYRFILTALPIYNAQPEKAIELMEEGLSQMSPKEPNYAYYLWRQKALIELIFLGNTRAAIQSQEKAAEWASAYSDAEAQGVAQLARQTAEILRTNPDSKAVQISSWVTVLEQAVDQRTREIAIAQLEKLGVQVETTPDGQVQLQLPQQN